MATVALLVPLSAGPAGAGTPGTAASWCQGGKDRANTGFQPAETVITRETVGSLTRRYVLAGTTGLPTVVGGVGWVPAGGSLVSFDTATGRVRWRARTVTTPYHDNTISGSPAVSDGLVFVNVANGGFGAPLQAFDAASGRLVWRTTEPPLGNPAAANGRVFQTVNAPGGADVVTAYDAKTGRRLWARTVAQEASTDEFAVASGLVVARSQTRMTAVDAVTGVIRWRVEVPFGAGDPVLANGLAYAVGDDEVAAYDLASGARRWSARVAASNGRTPAVAGETLYVLDDNRISALDARTGQVRWSTAFPGGYVFGDQPTVAGGVVHLSTGLTFDAATGAPLGRYPAAEGVVVVGGSVYTDSENGLAALRPTR